LILLTGGTGFVGRHLASQFAFEGHRVRVLSRTPDRTVLPDGVSLVKGDLTDPASLRVAMCDIGTVVHAGAALQNGSRSHAELERVNASGTAALAQIARNAGVRQFVHISSAGVYGDGDTSSPHLESDTPAPVTPYEQSKLSGEKALVSTLEGSKVQWTILRPQGLYGANRPATAAFFQLVARKKLWLHGPANIVVHPTHIDDLASAVRLVLKRDDTHHEIFNIGGERWLDYRELITLTGAALGRVPIQLRAPRWTSQVVGLGVRAWSANSRPPDLLVRLARTWVNRAVSIEKARYRLGFEPLTLAAGIYQTATELLRDAERYGIAR
jgi:nucleoside-diphosphate-sugar epimerase